MNAVEIEQAVSELAAQPYNAAEFPFALLAAFGSKETTLRRLRSGNSNKSDVPGGVLQHNNIHLATCEPGGLGACFAALRASPATTRAKAKFVLATDGAEVEAEDLASGETLACALADLPDHFGFLLPLAGISTIREIKDNPIDVRATGRLNKLYVELLRENPGWATDERRSAMNHFMARLVFCFFAEDTGIFATTGLFTQTLDRMADRDGTNTHEVLAEIFRAMNVASSQRATASPRLPTWADAFPYVNGGLFSGPTEAPRFSRMARTYLMHAGALNWREINPDIFGSMIQAVADDEERGALGMHYTSVPNILKVLNPLFLDDLRQALQEAGDSKLKLLNLKKRIARIRVFDPACGSGNFLVIAYKQMREIEAEIHRRRGEPGLGSSIPLTNFRGIEIRDFPAEIARLALIIAEFQCDVLYRGQQNAVADFLPLQKENWIVRGNALRLDWRSVCPPSGSAVKVVGNDLFDSTLDQAEIDFEHEEGETLICGNPPYKGSQDQTPEQKEDLAYAFRHTPISTKAIDYVTGWFITARHYLEGTGAAASFVATNSIHQGRQVSVLWPHLLTSGVGIRFARPSFPWSNLASNKAVVTVSIIGLGRLESTACIYEGDIRKECRFIGPYLVPDESAVVAPARRPLSALSPMLNGSMPNDGGGLLMTQDAARQLASRSAVAAQVIKRFVGTNSIIHGDHRCCLWIDQSALKTALSVPEIAQRIESVRAHRAASNRSATEALANVPHQFGEVRHSGSRAAFIARHSEERRPYLPFDIDDGSSVLGDSAILLPSFGVHELAVFGSRLHYVWARSVCGQLETRIRYSNTLGWNTFPVPLLTEQNKLDLTRCAEDILLAREAHFPATIADLYDPDAMPEDLKRAHDRNDETLERIYIGRRFRNDTERLEKLFELYTKMTAADKAKPAAKKTTRRRAPSA